MDHPQDAATFAADGRPLTDDLGREPEISQPDFVQFAVRVNTDPEGRPSGHYRQCFELEGGRWEGFVALVGPARLRPLPTPAL
jgi:hypothetical protein